MKTGNAWEICDVLEIMTGMLNKRSNTPKAVKDVHIRYIFHVVNLALESSLNLIHRNDLAIRALLSGMRGLVRRRDLYESTKNHLGLTGSLPSGNEKPSSKE